MLVPLERLEPSPRTLDGVRGASGQPSPQDCSSWGQRKATTKPMLRPLRPRGHREAVPSCRRGLCPLPPRPPSSLGPQRAGFPLTCAGGYKPQKTVAHKGTAPCRASGSAGAPGTHPTSPMAPPSPCVRRLHVCPASTRCLCQEGQRPLTQEGQRPLTCHSPAPPCPPAAGHVLRALRSIPRHPSRRPLSRLDVGLEG